VALQLGEWQTVLNSSSTLLLTNDVHPGQHRRCPLRLLLGGIAHRQQVLRQNEDAERRVLRQLATLCE
jgi:hypothetical protein